jgi:hypothetical protein
VHIYISQIDISIMTIVFNLLLRSSQVDNIKSFVSFTGN